jgi:hypothetical protein
MDRCTALETENADLRSQVHQLTTENARLRGLSVAGSHPSSHSTGTSTSAHSTELPSYQGATDTSVRLAANTFRFTAVAAPPPPRKPPALTMEELNALGVRSQKSSSPARACAMSAQVETKNGEVQDSVLGATGTLAPAVQISHCTGSGASVPLEKSVNTMENHGMPTDSGQSRRKRQARRDFDGILGRPTKLQGVCCSWILHRLLSYAIASPTSSAWGYVLRCLMQWHAHQ